MRPVTPHEREELLGGPPLVVWLTGLSGAGKTTLARALEQHLVRERKRAAFVLDGDTVRERLCGDLGFAPEDRDENVRRVSEVAALLADAGHVVIASLISPLAAHRALARQIVDPTRFFLVHVATPLDACRARDVKGLYARSARGELPGLTGVDAPYQEPLQPDLRLDTAGRALEESLARLVAALAPRLGQSK